MNKKIHFKGELAQFGSEFNVSVNKVGDIFRLIGCQIPEFKAYLIKALEAGLDLAIVSTKDLVIEDPIELAMDNSHEEFYISLIPAGSGIFGKILAAAIFFAASFIPGLGTFAGGFLQTAFQSIAVALALQGVTQLLAKNPETGAEEEGPGIFDGPINTVKAGQPVPILYGELLVGGAPIHVSLTTQNARRVGPSIAPDPTVQGTDGSGTGIGNVNYVPQGDDINDILNNLPIYYSGGYWNFNF